MVVCCAVGPAVIGAVAGSAIGGVGDNGLAVLAAVIAALHAAAAALAAVMASRLA